MGNLFVVFNVYPEEPGQEVQVEADIRKLFGDKLKDVKAQPIAFGLQMIKAGFIIPDKVAGLQQEIEDQLKTIPNVREIEMGETTLL